MWEVNFKKKDKSGKKNRRDRPELRVARIEIVAVQRDTFNPEVTKNARARMTLNDLTSAGVYCYLNEHFPLGSTIELIFPQPEPFCFKATVAHIQSIEGTTRILSADPFPFKVALKFQYLFDKDRDAAEEFLAKLFAYYKVGYQEKKAA